MNKATYYQRCVITMAFFYWPSIQAAGYLMHRIPRNKEKLQAYQQEYARQKRAPRHRKVSRAERALSEEKHVQRHNLLTAAEDLLPCSKAAIGLCICPSFCHLVLTQTSSGYKCLLIVHSLAADPQRTPDMIEEEAKAQDYFEELKDTLQLFCLCGWIDQFQNTLRTSFKSSLPRQQVLWQYQAQKRKTPPAFMDYDAW